MRDRNAYLRLTEAVVLLERGARELWETVVCGGGGGTVALLRAGRVLSDGRCACVLVCCLWSSLCPGLCIALWPAAMARGGCIACICASIRLSHSPAAKAVAAVARAGDVSAGRINKRRGSPWRAPVRFPTSEARSATRRVSLSLCHSLSLSPPLPASRHPPSPHILLCSSAPPCARVRASRHRNASRGELQLVHPQGRLEAHQDHEHARPLARR